MSQPNFVLTPEMLLSAYCQGVFPMAHEGEGIYWYDPDPRAILPLDNFHLPRRLARTIRQAPFDVRYDTSFTAVMRACAESAPDRPSTWISEELIDVYTRLYQLGFAHSVECWQGKQLVGGLYGVSVRGLFAGESMFSRERDASKVALVALVQHLQAHHFTLLDTQFTTPHLRRFGVIEISRDAYREQLQKALQAEVRF